MFPDILINCMAYLLADYHSVVASLLSICAFLLIIKIRKISDIINNGKAIVDIFTTYLKDSIKFMHTFY
jgi:hypothetical protein